MTPRTLKILAYLHRAGPSRLVDASREAGLSRSSAHGVLTRLARHGLVVHSGRGGVWSLAFPDIDPTKEYDATVPGYELMYLKAEARRDTKVPGYAVMYFRTQGERNG